MECWKCGKALNLPEGKLSFRATCDHCHAWLHACCNCRHYRLGLPNNCAIPGTEYVADREGANFCEEFSLLGKAAEQGEGPDQVAKRLFGDD